MNPKDAIAARKPQLHLVPPASIIREAQAMENGAAKYGPFNWRHEDRKVNASVYVGACLRHLLSWFDGEEVADDSGVHHLGHAKACLGILLDAMETGHMIDDRPPTGAAGRMIAMTLKLDAPVSSVVVNADDLSAGDMERLNVEEHMRQRAVAYDVPVHPATYTGSQEVPPTVSSAHDAVAEQLDRLAPRCVLEGCSNEEVWAGLCAAHGGVRPTDDEEIPF